MNIIEYEDDAIAHAVTASVLVGIGRSLSRIGDSAQTELWHGYIPEQQLVKEFWPTLMRCFETDNDKYRNYQADIIYQSVGDLTDVNSIYSTGIKLTFITEQQHREITKQNQSRLFE